MLPETYILHGGRTYPVAALVKQNGIPCVVIRSDDAVMTIPLAAVVEAPVRTRPVLVVDNT